jgi:hypothetical protein
MKERSSALAGFLVAPVVCGLLLAGSSLLAKQAGLHDLPVLFLTGYVFSFAAALVFGLPAFLVLRYCELVYWWSATAVGFVIGALIGIELQRPGLNFGSMPLTAAAIGAGPNLLMFGTMGAAAAFVFWLVWRNGYARVS